MAPALEYGPLASRGEDEQMRDVLTQCFGFPAPRWPVYVEQMGRENFRRLLRGRKLVAALGIYPLGQWFGGRSIPTGGIAVVGVPPEERGTGAALELMAQTLRELRGRGVPLSTLYPATQRLYRKVGYEQAGTHCRHTIPAGKIALRERPLPVEPIPVAEHGLLQEAYRMRAMRSAGNLDRSETFWKRITTSPDEPIYAYLLGSRGDPEGYLIFTQGRVEQSNRVHVRDMVALTPRAAAGLWTFLADHRSVVRDVSWIGPSTDPLTALIPEQDNRLVHEERWFLRIVEVGAALERRGYPEGIEAELRLEVKDEILPENEGMYRFRLAGSKAEVTRETPGAGARDPDGPGGSGPGRPGRPTPLLRTHIRGLATLYSGLFTPTQLASLGWIEAGADALAVAARVFAGPEPWMPDGF